MPRGARPSSTAETPPIELGPRGQSGRFGESAGETPLIELVEIKAEVPVVGLDKLDQRSGLDKLDQRSGLDKLDQRSGLDKLDRRGLVRRSRSPPARPSHRNAMRRNRRAWAQLD